MARSSLFCLVLAIVVALAPACADDTPASPGAGSFVLADGSTVDVTAEGGFRVRVDGRVVFALSSAARITTRTYEERAQGLTGIWSFSREGEKVFPAGRFASTGARPDEVSLRFDGDATRSSVLVQIRPLRAQATLIHVEARAPGAEGAKSVAVPLECDAEATFFGFGEQYHAVEHRGEAFELFVSEQGIGRQPEAGRGIAGDQHTTYFPMPWFLDARGFGLLSRSPYRTLVDLCRADPRVAWMEAESGAPLDLVVFHGPRPLDVIRQLGDEVGRPRTPPPWAFGTWIGAQGGRDAVLARAARIEASKIPSRVLWVQDWTGERRNFGGGFGVKYRWKEDTTRYPDLAGTIAELKARGFRFLAYANPFVVRGLEHFDAMAKGGMLVKRPDGSVYEHVAPNGSAATPDFTNPATYTYVRSAFGDMFGRLGMDGMMADFGEWAPLDGVYASGADPRAEHQLFPLRWHKAWRGLLDELRPDGDWVVFARSGFTGVQGVAQVYWVGDQEADFSIHDGLPTVVPAMLSLGISGVPFVTHDVAGFSGGPSTKELYMRWTELGAFSPILRTHDGNQKDLNWSWDKDAETQAHFERMSIVHERLLPELRTLATEAGLSGAPLLRHLMLAYPEDPESRKTHDQMLLGERLLIAPVVEDGARTRSVYFPPGAPWFDIWTGARHEGGRREVVDAPLGSPPVFARDVDRTDLRAP